MEDEQPEWTAADFTKARPAREVLPQIFSAKVTQEMLKPQDKSPPEHQRQ